MAPAAASSSSSSLKGQWRPTKIMNMRDLSRDDDFLSHLLVEKMGTGDVPLVVHKMDPTRRLPKTNADELLLIVRRMVVTKGSQSNAIRQAVDGLLSLNAVKYYLKSSYYDQKQVNAFATHASRYFELYLPGGSIEIAHTSRYAHRTGKSELCILATRPLAPGTVITELKGSMADLTEEEDKELKRTDERHADGVGIRRDFSVIHSKQLKKNHLFLGPARFVNHDCDHNSELFREGRYITFRVIKPVSVGEEVTAHYGDGYFGRKNRHCLCATCERNGRGGYGPQASEEDVSDAASTPVRDAQEVHESSSHSSDSEEDESSDETVNCNERRTRRGVYAVMPDPDKNSLSEPEVDKETTSDLTSLPPLSSISSPLPNGHGLPTPEPEPEAEAEAERGRSKGKARETITAPIAPIPVKATSSNSSSAVPFRSVISTRSQKAREASSGASTSRAESQSMARRSVSTARQLVTPPLTVDSAANSVRSSSRLKSRDAAAEEGSHLSTPMKDRKGKGRATASVSDVRDVEKDEPEARHLRPRISAPIFDLTLSKKKLVDAPRGLDGKPLPLCATCGNVLPVISVDSEIVWGLSLGRTGKRGRPKKDQALECPRCIRHYAIYDRKWPERVAGDGSRLLVPPVRDDIHAKKIANNAPANMTRKVGPTTASASAPVKRTHVEEEVRPSKKAKLTSGRPRGRPPKTKVGMSEKAREILNANNSDGRRSGRARVPSLKMRESEPPTLPKTRISPRKAPLSSSSLSAASDSPPMERHTTPPNEDPSTSSVPIIKIVTPKSLAVAAQPRESNGRFGKKAATNGRYMRGRPFAAGGRRLCKGPKTSYLTRRTAESVNDGEDRSEVSDAGSEDDDDNPFDDPYSDALSSDPVEIYEFGEEALEDVVLKRSVESDDPDSQPSKKQRVTDEDDSDLSPIAAPRFGLGRGSLLRPNPISFARRKWASADEDQNPAVESSFKSFLPVGLTDEFDDLPPTDIPEHHRVGISSNGVPPAAAGDSETATTDDSDESVAPSPPSRLLQPTARLARLTFRPSPMNLAKRRWIPTLLPQKQSSESFSPVATLEPAFQEIPVLTQSHRPYKRSSAKASSLPKFTLAGTELDDDFPFGELEYPTDSGGDSDGEQDRNDDGVGSAASHLRPAGTEARTHDAARRPASPDVVVVDSVYSTDDSEQIVERLIGMPSRSPSRTSLRPTSARTRSPSPRSASFTRSLPRNPESPPGLDWKRTVLIPTKHIPSRSDQYAVKDAIAHRTTLTSLSALEASVRAGPSSGSLPHVALRLSGPVLAPNIQRALSSSSHSPSPLLTPTIAAPVHLTHAGWDSGSDADSP